MLCGCQCAAAIFSALSLYSEQQSSCVSMQLRLNLTNFLLNGMHSVKDSLVMEEPELRTQVLSPATLLPTS